MKGLRLTQIKSHGFKLGFNRYQLWEHEVIYCQQSRPHFWMPGKIIHHLVSWMEASEYFKALAPQYDLIDVELDKHNLEVD